MIHTDSTDPKDHNDEEESGQTRKSPNEQEDLEDNDVQRGLTGETDDEEDVGGDLAGNASGNG
ncbi:hypothetical protein [Pedobacter sandarakinus]|uniref:hypothetical protein n=1 Tax=Pedobacter sandarakinus TaxID=353156 RepID=UPI0022475AE3|nr:hypothetical protein [Pedobacter sandarakinus]MCX2574973.1 hypothetical protein [Pedobacter sandarakinus]